MAWTAPMTAVANTAFTASQFNTYVRDNLLETSPALAANAGGYFVADGTNSIVERTVGSDRVLAEEESSSTSYTDLSTHGPSVTVTTGTQALVIITTRAANITSTNVALMSPQISGSSSVAASDDNAVQMDDNELFTRASVVRWFTGLTAGSNTFTAKYRVTGGTGSWRRRDMIVLPF